MFGNRLNLIKSIVIQLFLLTSICSMAMKSPENDNQSNEKFPRLLSYNSQDGSPGLSTNSSSIFSPIMQKSDCKQFLLDVANSHKYNVSPSESLEDCNSLDMNLDSNRTTPVQTHVPFSRQVSEVALKRQGSDVSLERMVASASMCSNLFGMGKDDGLDVQDLQCGSSVFDENDLIVLAREQSAHRKSAAQMLSAIRNLQIKDQE